MKLYLIFAGILISLLAGFYGYFSYSQNKIYNLAESNTELTIAVEQQSESVKALENFNRRQSANLLNLQAANKTLQQEKLELSNKLIKHDWEEISRRKPILMQNRINNGTKELFDSLESISSD